MSDRFPFENDGRERQRQRESVEERVLREMSECLGKWKNAFCTCPTKHVVEYQSSEPHFYNLILK